MWWCSGVPCFEPIEKRLKVKEREICIWINWLDALIFQASRHEEEAKASQKESAMMPPFG